MKLILQSATAKKNIMVDNKELLILKIYKKLKYKI